MLKGTVGLKVLGLSMMLALGQPAYAFYCSTPKGNGFINMGDNMTQVERACGKPTFEQVKQVGADRLTTTQYWYYDNLQVYEESPLAVNGPYRSVENTGQPLVFEVHDSQITAITQGGKTVKRTDQCDTGRNVRVGDKVDKLLSACGQPTSVNTQSKNLQSDKRDITVWTYDMGQYAQPLELQFEEGKLININQ